MIFGTKPVYRFAVYNKKKMHCLGKSYNFDQPPVDVKECPVKIVDQKAELFFPNPIFNTYLLSIENSVSILKSYDDKLTYSKSVMEQNTLYTVKTISEDDKTREVEEYKFDEYFPGFKTKGRIEISENKPIFRCEYGTGPITLQSNNIKKETEAMLVSLDSSGSTFVEINNPIERVMVRIVKDLNNHKIVENENIKGILIDARDRKINEEVNVYVKNIYPGSYCFIEDIMPGIAEVDLLGKEGNIYKVKYKHFTGICKDKKVKKRMKGTIFNIKKDSFEFIQESENEMKRSEDYQNVSVPKRIKISDETEIKGNPSKAIEFIRYKIENGRLLNNNKLASNKLDDNKIEKDNNKLDNNKLDNNKLDDNKLHDNKTEIIQLFKKYIQKIQENDSLCLFYLKYLSDNENIKEGDLNYILKYSKGSFPSLASEQFDEPEILKMIFNKKKSLSGFKKLLNHEKDKTKLMKENPEFIEYSIKYAYENMQSPRVVVENIIGGSHKSWMLYASLEEGNIKRSIFRRMAQMNFKKNEMKEVFKAWLSFEETVGGNVEEVHKLANDFVQSSKKAD